MEFICCKCKARLPSDSLFCQYCGASIHKTENSYPSAGKVVNCTHNTRRTYLSSHNSSKKKANKKPVIITIVAVLAVALIAGIVVFSSVNNDNYSSDSRPKTINNVSVRTITFSDKVTAEYVFSTWQSGKATEQSLVELMNKYGAEQGDQGAGRLYLITPGEYVEEIDEWCFSPNRKIGDCAIIQNAYGYSICYISDINSESGYHVG